MRGRPSGLMRGVVVYSLSHIRLLHNRMDCSPPGSSVHGILLGKNTGVGCHFLLQGIFLTQGSNPGLLHCRQILYHLSHQGRPRHSRTRVKTSQHLWRVSGELGTVLPTLFHNPAQEVLFVFFSQRNQRREGRVAYPRPHCQRLQSHQAV